MDDFDNGIDKRVFACSDDRLETHVDSIVRVLNGSFEVDRAEQAVWASDVVALNLFNGRCLEYTDKMSLDSSGQQVALRDQLADFILHILLRLLWSQKLTSYESEEPSKLFLDIHGQQVILLPKEL